MYQLLLTCLLVIGQWSIASDTQVIEKAIANKARSEADLKRDERSKPGKLLAFADLGPGMVVADIFSGDGYYSELFSYIVGKDGKVYAQNNKPWSSFLAGKDKARYADRLPNVTYLVTEASDLKLPKGQVDRLFMVMTYHDLYHVTPSWPKIDAQQFLKQLYDSVKPGGKVIIVDHEAAAGKGEKDAQNLHRIEASYARRDFESVGFVYEKDADFLHNPDDDRSVSVFAPNIRGKTHRFVMMLRKPTK